MVPQPLVTQKDEEGAVVLGRVDLRDAIEDLELAPQILVRRQFFEAEERVAGQHVEVGLEVADALRGRRDLLPYDGRALALQI